MKISVEKRPVYDGGVVWNAGPLDTLHRFVEGWVRPASLIRKYQEAKVSWSSIGSVSPDEARAFAAAIIEIANAVEAEAKRQEGRA